MAQSLRIGGLTPLTTQDYPGELAAVVFCQGCSWRCEYCQNAHLLDPRASTFMGWDTARSFLATRRGLLDAVVFSGGEPTTQVAVGSAMAEVRELGFKVGLHTGGACPERLERLLPRFDWVGLDIKGTPEDYPRITGIPGSGVKAWRSLRLLLAAGVDCEVRTTPSPGFDDHGYLRDLMERLAAVGVHRYVLQQCRGVPTARVIASHHWPQTPFSQFHVRSS